MRWQIERVLDLARAGFPVYRAAEEASVSYWAALRLCHAARVKVKRGRRRGSRFPNVDPIQKARALAMIAEGAKLRDAAVAVGVSHEAVRQWAQQEDVPLPRARKRRAPGAPWANSPKKMISKPEASKAPPPDPRTITVRGVTLARFA
jgi:hypothetical protein